MMTMIIDCHDHDDDANLKPPLWSLPGSCIIVVNQIWGKHVRIAMMMNMLMKGIGRGHARYCYKVAEYFMGNHNTTLWNNIWVLNLRYVPISNVPTPNSTYTYFFPFNNNHCPQPRTLLQVYLSLDPSEATKQNTGAITQRGISIILIEESDSCAVFLDGSVKPGYAPLPHCHTATLPLCHPVAIAITSHSFSHLHPYHVITRQLGPT